LLLLLLLLWCHGGDSNAVRLAVLWLPAAENNANEAVWKTGVVGMCTDRPDDANDETTTPEISSRARLQDSSKQFSTP
jgi:hypothetical protein